MKGKLVVIALVGALGALIVGCSQQARDQYAEAGQDVTKAANRTGKAVATDAANSETAADNLLESTRVKGALDSAAGLQTKNINVLTDEKALTITLNGSVPNAKQKAQAETVAKGIGGSKFKIVSNLKVVAS